MKKIIIVNNNMKVGGVQKSLSNLLWTIEKDYEITLLLFDKAGAYLQDLPESVKVVSCDGPFRFLGISQGECRGFDKLKRGALATICKMFGRETAIRCMLPGQRILEGEYDHAIAFLHNGNEKSFYGGVQEYVLQRVKAKKKTAVLHCDYSLCGGHAPMNDKLLDRFDTIAACSEGCARVLLEHLPHLKEKCTTVPNCHRYAQIHELADATPVQYAPSAVHVLVVGRLAHEKGIERAVEAVAQVRKKDLPVILHIVGGGPMERPLREQINSLGIQEVVVFHGEQVNPYRYMRNADLLLIPSYHEAAPMVIDEACALALPVLTAETTSSKEMVTDRGAGWVCENNQQAITVALENILRRPEQLLAIKQKLGNYPANNNLAQKKFRAMIEGEL